MPAALVFALVAAAPSASAQDALDPAAAREHLTQGYKLKQQGQLREALPHFVESLRLDPKLKTTINLADVEEKLGMLGKFRRMQFGLDSLLNFLNGVHGAASQEQVAAVKQKIAELLKADEE